MRPAKADALGDLGNSCDATIISEPVNGMLRHRLGSRGSGFDFATYHIGAENLSLNLNPEYPIPST